MTTARALLVSVSVLCLLPFAALAQTQTAPAPTVISAPPAAPLAPAAGPAAAAPAPAMTPAAAAGPVTRGEIAALVREAIMNDPAMIMDAIKKLREQQANAALKTSKEALEKRKEDIFNDPNSPTVGDAKTADITIVEFFDYHCGYCKHLLPPVSQLLKEDKKVRFVFKEFPILSDESVSASRAALAVNRIAKDKYFDYHTALMKQEGKFDEKTLLDHATKLGVNAEKVKAEMNKPEITAELDKNRDLAQAMGIRGTPALVIGNNLLPGAMSYEELKRTVQEIRAGKSPSILDSNSGPADVPVDGGPPPADAPQN